MIKLIVADDHQIFREGLKTILQSQGIASVIGQAANGIQLVELVDANQPDVVITDISMPQMDGIEATERIRAKYPDIKIIALTSFGEEAYLLRMVKAGVNGFIVKDAGIAEIERCIAEVLKGGSYVSAGMLRSMAVGKKRMEDSSSVTDEDEKKLLGLLCNGASDAEIAQKMSLNLLLVPILRQALMDKTNSKDISDLALYGLRNKLLG